MKTSIRMENMRFFAYHGVMPQERVTGNDFIVNIRLSADLSAACRSDDVNDTVSYADVFRLVKEEMEQPSKLLEHVAGRIYRRITSAYPVIDQLEVCVSKLNPPVDGQMDCASVIVGDGRMKDEV